jgi:two-component system sensor histidine kinase KdpD
MAGPAIIKPKKQYLYSITIVILVSLASFVLSDAVGYKVVALILLLTVSVLAMVFDIFPVLISASLSAFIWDVFFIPPKFTFHVNTTEDTILLVMYFVIALINAVLTYKIRQLEKASRIREEKANSVKLYNTILNSLSHELRTPIAAIIGAADNLQGNRNLTEENKMLLVSEISKASLRLNQQVENLLNISRLESGHIKPKNDWCDIVELVYSTCKIVEENNPKRNIRISINQDLPLCYLDKGMLEQVIYNLLNNAAIHTDKSTRIDISAVCHADLLQVMIEDNGHGFTEEARKNVFKKFSRDKDRRHSGSGLGLSIVKGFSEALGGTVELQTSRGKGSRFTISIPVKTSFTKIYEL